MTASFGPICATRSHSFWTSSRDSGFFPEPWPTACLDIAGGAQSGGLEFLVLIQIPVLSVGIIGTANVLRWVIILVLFVQLRHTFRIGVYFDEQSVQN